MAAYRRLELGRRDELMDLAGEGYRNGRASTWGDLLRADMRLSVLTDAPQLESATADLYLAVDQSALPLTTTLELGRFGLAY
jgi:hypothetical protein